jgi:hypothetical protein
MDTARAPQQLSVGVTRIAFTSVFRGDVALAQPVWGGTFSLRQQYRGASLLIGTTSFRDDELFRAEWRYQIVPNVSIIPRFEWDVSNDTRSLGIAKLERFRGASSIRVDAPVGSFLAFVGAERAEQLSVRESGSVVGGQFLAKPIAIGDFVIGARADGEYVRLRVRTNADVAGQLELSSLQGESGRFRLGIEHRRQQRDYYTTVGLSSTIALEHRTEQRWAITGELEQQIVPWLNVVLQPDVHIATVERFFNAPIQTSALTFVRRRLEELNGTLRAMLIAQLAESVHRIELTVGSRDESNATFDQYVSPTPQLVDELRQSERMRDNRSRLLQVSSMHAIAVLARDSIGLDLQSRIVRYDTPSPLNYDDRDELTLLGRLRYRHQWSDVMASRATIEYTGTHFVFLRAQRSALSNWNRSFRLACVSTYTQQGFSWNPSFEILSQYTSYDFEGRSGVPSSFSFRQVSYRDSIRWEVPGGSVEAQVFFRWFLRGDFSWSRFTEYPRGTGQEQFARSMYWRTGELLSFGIGCRWYLLEQQLAGTIATQLSSSQRSIAPEAGIRLQLEQLYLELGGWYEIRTLPDGRRQALPNLSLNLTRRL